jgi:AcrR family transcriptional regulator
LSETKTPTPPSRRDRLRERLLDAAEKAICARGLAGLKAREIAAGAGCALGAIYTAFDDLDELILRVNARTLAKLESGLARAGAAARDGEAPLELMSLARAYLDFARQEEPRWRALFEHRLPDGRDVPEWYAQARNRLFGQLDTPLARLLPQEAPERRAQLARTLFSAVHGIVSLGMEEKLAPTPAATLEGQLENFIYLCAAGLTAPRP